MIDLIDLDKVREVLKNELPDAATFERITEIINNATAKVDMSERMVSLYEGEKIQALDTVMDWPSMSDNTISDFEQISNYWVGGYYDRSSTLPVFRKVENFF